jgi:uncharacterized protein involved in outer membrane biogenesis
VSSGIPESRRPKSRRRVLVVAAIVLAVAVTAALGVLRAVRSLDDPGVQQALLARVREASGVDVRASGMEVSLASGIRLVGVAVANPKPMRGDLLTAESVVLRYRLLPLLRGRLEIDALSVEKPELSMVLDANGTSNVAKLLARPRHERAAAVPAPVSLRLVVARAALSNGTVSVRDARSRLLFAAQGLDFTSAFESDGTSVTGKGRASIARAATATHAVEAVEADLAVTKALVHLSDVRGRMGSGRLAADVKIALPDARIVGRGEVAGYRAEASPLFAAIAAALQLPELARPEIEKGEVQFTLAGARLATSPVRLRGAGFELTGGGVCLLDSRAIDYDLTVALPRAVLARLPVSEMRAAFRDRGDGLATLDFKATGTTDAPRTDIAGRLARATAVAAAKKGLGRLLRRE